MIFRFSMVSRACGNPALPLSSFNKFHYSKFYIIYTLNLCMLGNFSVFVLFWLFFFQNWLFQKKSFMNTIRVSNGICQAWYGSKLFAKIISRWKKVTVAGKKFMDLITTHASISVHWVLYGLFFWVLKTCLDWCVITNLHSCFFLIWTYV